MKKIAAHKIIKALYISFSVLAVTLFSAVPAEARVRSGMKGENMWVYFLFLGVFIAASLIPTSIFAKKKKERDKFPTDYTRAISDEIKTIDPEFTDYTLTRYGEAHFQKIIDAISDRNIEALKEFETEELFQRQKAEIDDLNSSGRIRILSHAHIERSGLHLYRRDKNYEYVTVCISSQIKDYIIDGSDYSVKNGNKKLMIKHFLLTYMRSKKSKTEGKIKAIETNCPNCGAPISLNSSRQCPYCQAIIRSDDFDWVLSDFEILDSGSQADNRGILIEDNSEVKFTKGPSPFFTGYYDNGIEDPYKDPFSRTGVSEAYRDYINAANQLNNDRINREFRDR